MTGFIVHLVVSALLLVLVAQFVDGIQIAGFGSALIAALALGVCNCIVRPILIILTLPITLLTLGLFLFVINALMLSLASVLAPGFEIAGFGAAFIGAILLALFNLVASTVLNQDRPESK